MELGWVIIMTLKLTKANMLRIKETVLHFIDTNPLLSAILCVVIAALVIGFTLKYKNSA